MLATDLAAQVLSNIIVFYADDMGIGDTSAYLDRKLTPNSPAVAKTLTTPNLDRLADQGMVYTDVHTTSPTCTDVPPPDAPCVVVMRMG